MVYVETWILMVIITMKQVAGAREYCYCNPRAQHPQKHFCDSAFVVRAKILSISLEQNNLLDKRLRSIKYWVHVEQIYKHKKTKKSLLKLGLNTIWTEPLCTSYLTVNATNVIFGNYNRNILTTTYCHWNPVHISLSEEQETYLTKLYKRACRCKVVLCDDIEATDCKYSKKYCVLRWDFPKSFTSQCYFRYGICKKSKGECKFKENSMLRKCIKHQEKLLASIDEGSGDNEEGSGSTDDQSIVISNSLDELDSKI